LVLFSLHAHLSHQAWFILKIKHLDFSTDEDEELPAAPSFSPRESAPPLLLGGEYLEIPPGQLNPLDQLMHDLRTQLVQEQMIVRVQHEQQLREAQHNYDALVNSIIAERDMALRAHSHEIEETLMLALRKRKEITRGPGSVRVFLSWLKSFVA
jgi:hypothetical protein